MRSEVASKNMSDDKRQILAVYQRINDAMVNKVLDASISGEMGWVYKACQVRQTGKTVRRMYILYGAYLEQYST